MLSSSISQYENDLWKVRAIEKVSRNGLCLKNESPWCRSDPDIVQAAIRNNPFAIRYAPEFQRDKKMALLAVSINGLTRFWLSPDLQNDRDIRKASSKNFPIKRSVTGMVSPFNLDERIFSASWSRCPVIDKIGQLKCMSNELICVYFERVQCSRFVRDSHVTLFGGGHLIPYPIDNPLHSGLLRAMLPQSADHLLVNEVSGKISTEGMMGDGFKKLNVDQAMITAYDYNIAFRHGMTCIEGGNCYLLISKEQRKAIIGEVSLYLSMIALEDQGYFDEVHCESQDEPSSDAYRMARNLTLYFNERRPLDEKIHEEYVQMQSTEGNPASVAYSKDVFSSHIERSDLEKFGGEIGYRRLLMAPVSEEDKVQYVNEAHRIEVKLALTKACMAAELEVPLENIAFLPQSKFHIDMEMFVTPQGEVVIHDDQKAVEFLNEIQLTHILDGDETELFNQYWYTAQEHVASISNMQKMRAEILQKLDIDFRFFPGVFESSAFESALNYCNGIFAKSRSDRIVPMPKDNILSDVYSSKNNFTFITTGPSFKAEEVFHHRFTDMFKQSFPEFSLQTIPGVSNFISKYDGGIHCLTFENSLSFQ